METTMQSLYTPYTSSPPSEQLARRRVTATAIDLAFTGCCALLLFRVHWLFAVAAVALFLLRDTGRWASPGRIIASLNTVADGCKPCTALQSIKRNITLLPPMLFIEIGMLLFLRRHARIGDILAGTAVVPEGQAAAATQPANENADSREGENGAEDGTADEFTGELLDTGLLTPQSITEDDLSAQPSARTSTESTEPVVCVASTGTVNSTETAESVESADTAEPAGATVHYQPSAEEIIQRFTSESEIPAGVGHAPSIPAELAAKCLNMQGEITSDTLDDAYWQYVERYSLDAVSDFDDAALLQRCNELAEKQADLPVNISPPPSAASREKCISYLNSWMMIINKCRDALG